MDETHRSPAAGGDQAGTPSTNPSLGTPRPSDASSPWAGPQPPATPHPTPTDSEPPAPQAPGGYFGAGPYAGPGPHQTGPFPAWTAGGAHPTAPIGTLPPPHRRRGPLAAAI